MAGTLWTSSEDDIVRRERTIKAAAAYLPHRTLEMIKSRRKVLRVGKSNPAHRKWSPKEDRAVRRWFPRVDEIRRRLPHRSPKAIRDRALKTLKLRPQNLKWSREDLKRIATIPEGGLAALSEEIGRPLYAIHSARTRHGLTTRQTPDMSKAPQVVADVRAHVVSLGFSPRKVGAEHGDHHALGGRRIPNYRALRDVVESLGGEFWVEWDD